MTHFKTSKAELLFVVLPKDAYDVKISQLIGDRQKIRTRNESMPLPQGNWQLIGKLSEVSEEVAKGLVDEAEYGYLRGIQPGTIWSYKVALQNIATHLGMELTDNIYLLKKI